MRATGHETSMKKLVGVAGGGGWPTMRLHAATGGQPRKDELSGEGDSRRKGKE